MCMIMISRKFGTLFRWKIYQNIFDKFRLDNFGRNGRGGRCRKNRQKVHLENGKNRFSLTLIWVRQKTYNINYWHRFQVEIYHQKSDRNWKTDPNEKFRPIRCVDDNNTPNIDNNKKCWQSNIANIHFDPFLYFDPKSWYSQKSLTRKKTVQSAANICMKMFFR